RRDRRGRHAPLRGGRRAPRAALRGRRQDPRPAPQEARLLHAPLARTAAPHRARRGLRSRGGRRPPARRARRGPALTRGGGRGEADLRGYAGGAFRYLVPAPAEADPILQEARGGAGGRREQLIMAASPAPARGPTRTTPCGSTGWGRIPSLLHRDDPGS